MQNENPIKTYNIYPKNFEILKFILDEEYNKYKHNIILIIFFDNEIYQEFMSKFADDYKISDLFKIFINAFEETFEEVFDDREKGIFMISGDLSKNIVNTFNEIFGKFDNLTPEQKSNMNLDNNISKPYIYFINLIQIQFCPSRGLAVKNFNEIKKSFTE